MSMIGIYSVLSGSERENIFLLFGLSVMVMRIQLGTDVWENREMKVTGTGKFGVSELTLRASCF